MTLAFGAVLSGNRTPHLPLLCLPLPPSSWMRNSWLEIRVLWCGPSWFYLGSVQPLKFLLLGLSPSCLLHTPGQLGIQFFLCVSSWLERTRDFLSQVPEMFGHWLGRTWRAPSRLQNACRANRQARGVGRLPGCSPKCHRVYLKLHKWGAFSLWQGQKVQWSTDREVMQQRDICFFIVGISCFSYKDICSF